MGQTACLKALPGVADRCCFWGYLWTLTSKGVQFCEAPLPLGSHSLTSSFLPFLLPFPSFIFVPSSHHVEGATVTSCSCITSPNPPPSVCISPVLIAPEIHSNGPEMYARVQLTGSPHFIVPPFSHITSFPSPVWSLLLTPRLICLLLPTCSSRIRASYVHLLLRKPPSSWTQPSLHAAPAGQTLMRMKDATHTCFSLCTFTNIAWRRAARVEVSIPALLLRI